jgi:hypothetical protein
MIGLFAVAIPAVLYGILLFWKQPEVSLFLRSMLETSFTIGAVLFVILAGLIAVEQVQDHSFDLRYRKHRDRKLPLANGNFECQYCGNQQVKEKDKTCRVCGKDLK